MAAYTPSSLLNKLELLTPVLIGKVYELAPLRLRARMLELMVRPLGVLALAAVANGVFARLRLRSTEPELLVQPEDILSVQPADVMALADRVQYVGAEVFDGLLGMMASTPALAGSLAALLLIAALLKRRQQCRLVDDLE